MQNRLIFSSRGIVGPIALMRSKNYYLEVKCWCFNQPCDLTGEGWSKVLHRLLWHVAKIKNRKQIMHSSARFLIKQVALKFESMNKESVQKTPKR